MIVLQGLQALVWFGIIPYILGKFLNNKDEEKNTILYNILIGNIMEMGVFFIVALPMILLKWKYIVLRNVYLIIIILLCVISILKNKKKILQFSKMKSFSIFQIIAIILVIMQVFMKIKYTIINNDDSSFVVLSNQMIDTGDMYKSGDGLNSRRALAPISAYYSVMSQYLFVHVTIFTHTVIPIVFTILANIVYYYLGKTLFKEDKDLPYIFLIFMTLANFYFFRFKGAGSYFLRFTWFGRSILAGMLLPLLWKVSLETMDKSGNNLFNWITILFIVLSSCLCTEMSIALIPLSIVIFAIIRAIQDKKLSYLLKSILTIIPCLIVAMIYIIIR